jgi:hypothetical protein
VQFDGLKVHCDHSHTEQPTAAMLLIGCLLRLAEQMGAMLLMLEIQGI